MEKLWTLVSQVNQLCLQVPILQILEIRVSYLFNYIDVEFNIDVTLSMGDKDIIY